MTTHLETKLEITSWDEKPYRELDDGRKFTRSNVTMAVSEDAIEAEATWEALACYAADGTGTYVGLMHIVGRLGDRAGSFVQQFSGTYDGKQARVETVIVPWAATGELRGLRGTGESVSTHDDYPFMPLTLAYDLE
jgi:hypothetical protein